MKTPGASLALFVAPRNKKLNLLAFVASSSVYPHRGECVDPACRTVLWQNAHADHGVATARPRWRSASSKHRDSAGLRRAEETRGGAPPAGRQSAPARHDGPGSRGLSTAGARPTSLLPEPIAFLRNRLTADAPGPGGPGTREISGKAKCKGRGAVDRDPGFGPGARRVHPGNGRGAGPAGTNRSAEGAAR